MIQNVQGLVVLGLILPLHYALALRASVLKGGLRRTPGPAAGHYITHDIPSVEVSASSSMLFSCSQSQHGGLNATLALCILGTGIWGAAGGIVKGPHAAGMCWAKARQLLLGRVTNVDINVFAMV